MPVLEGVVGQHDDPPADHECGDGRRERRPQGTELVVDLDAQRLEGALGRVAPGAAGCRGDGVADQLGQPGVEVMRSCARARTMAWAMRRANRSSP